MEEGKGNRRKTSPSTRHAKNEGTHIYSKRSRYKQIMKDLTFM